MTVLTAIENSSPEDSVTFTETGVRDVTWDSSNIGMKLGETITMKDCWYAAIIKSANEVCAQMAEYVGGTEAQFIEMMNEKARELGCRNTHFANASGLPDSNHYTTAYDLYLIFNEAMKLPKFREIIGADAYTAQPIIRFRLQTSARQEECILICLLWQKNPIFIMKAALAEKQEIPMTQAIPL